MKKMIIFFAVISMMIVNRASAQCDSNLTLNVSQWLICHDDSVKVTSPTGDIWTSSIFTSYSWVYSAEGSPSVSIPSNTNVAWIKMPKHGTVSLTVTKSKGGCMYGEVPLVDVAPKVKIYSNSKQLNNHDTIMVTNGNSQTIYGQFQNENCLSTYSWYNTKTKSKESTLTSFLSKEGSYTLKVMNNDNRPCATFSDTITFLFSKATGMESSISESLISVYPNPFVDYMIIDNLDYETSVSINDINGKTIYQKISENGTLKIDTTEWPNGFYFVKIGDSSPKRILKY